MTLFDESSDEGGRDLMVHGDGPLALNLSPADTPTSSTTTMHDQWLTVRPGTKLADFTQDMWERLEACRDISGFAKNPRQDASERRRQVFANLTANLALTALSRAPGHRLIVSAEKGARTRYDRPGLTPNLVATMMQTMVATGLIDHAAGVSRKLRTTIAPTPRLIAMFAEAGATLADLGRAPGAECIILKADLGSRRPKAMVDYSDSPETIRLRGEMAMLNLALNAADIRLDGAKPPPSHLVRIFQIPSPEAPHRFDQYGRIYRGWWQDLRRIQRRLITIAGEPVCDLDFRAAFLSIAYARQGTAMRPGDPYRVPGLEHHRAGTKQAISSLFFRHGYLKRISPELRALLPDGWNAARLEAAITNHHWAIAKHFGTNFGPRLTNMEANIMTAVLLRLAREGVAALGCHDGLLCAQSRREAAMRAMRELSEQMLGVALEVVEKPL